MISFSHVYKTYPGPMHALRDVSFEIEKGEFVFVTGPSGAGKTTLFRLISAYDRPSSGHVQVGHYDIATVPSQKVPYLRRNIGVVFQDFKLLKDRTAIENVMMPLQVMGERPMSIRKRAEEVMEIVGLKYKHEQFPEQMSGGEQQRVAIARAIVHRPGFLIADEPTGNLDHELSIEIMKVIENVNAQGTTVFVATHDRSLVEGGRRRNIAIREGRVEMSA